MKKKKQMKIDEILKKNKLGKMQKVFFLNHKKIGNFKVRLEMVKKSKIIEEMCGKIKKKNYKYIFCKFKTIL